MAVRWKHRTGHLSRVSSSLIRSLSQYHRYHGEFKVGVTVNPEARLRNHQRDEGWGNLVTLYLTYSRKSAGKAEKLLVDHGWRIDYGAECWNERRGGSGIPYGVREYYLYVLLP